MWIHGSPVPKITEDGEFWITETERENDVWVQYSAAFSSTTYIILVSKNNGAFPHKLQGQNGERIDVTSTYYGLDLAANSAGTIKFGVISRIDGTDADIEYFFGVPFLSGVSKEVLVQQLRGVPSQVKLDLIGSVLQHGITNTNEINVAGVNTVTTLDSPAGNILPGKGDIIIKYEHSSGSSNFGIFMFYHNSE